MATSYGVYGDNTHTPHSSSHSPALLPDTSVSSRDRKKKQQQPRQLLSCTKCRERKVKCDRTKPCSACCARGLPKECHFVLGEGTEFGPIQQSLELRKLRGENQRLKERLIAAKLPLSDDSDEDDTSSTGRGGPSNRRAASRQKRFRTNENTDSLYFGSPGLANVISDFANMQVESKSLAFTMPRAADMYAGNISMYPFPALWQATTATEGLLQCLEPREHLFAYLDTFAKTAVGFAFPFMPDELTHKEVDHFLQDAEQNAAMYPDALALILAGAALGIQLGGEKEEREDRLRRGDVFIAAVMQALRASGFMSRPTLRSLQALLLLGPYLTNSGRFLDAWSLFGLTIRLAQSIGLHRSPKYLDPVPDFREITIRSNIWWWMLHTDQLYSMTLGRPLGISGIGDCSPAELLTTNPAVLRLGEFVDQLTLLGRQILSSNQLTDARIDMFTDRLISLWDTIPDTLQFNDSWSNPDTSIPEYPLCATAAVHYCKIHNYIILLNRQRIENTRATPEYTSPSPRSFQPVSTGPGFHDLPFLRPHTVPRGKPMVLQSSTALLDAFVYFFKRVPVALVDWSIGQQAFNACLILLLDALETCETQNVGIVEQAYVIFLKLDQDHMHELAEMAVSRISEGLLRLREAIESKVTPPGSTRTTSLNEVAAGQKKSRKHSEVAPEESAMSDHYSESVMGNTGMILLEDPGLQSNRMYTTTMPLAVQTSQPSLSTLSAQPVDIPKPTIRRHSAQPIAHKPRMQQQTYPPRSGIPPQPALYQYPPSQSLPSGYNNYTSQQGSGFAVGVQPRLLPRRDSVTAGSGHLITQTVRSSSPHTISGGQHGQPAIQTQSGLYYQVPMMYQQPPMAPPPHHHQQQQQQQQQPQQQQQQQQQSQQQRSEHEWRTLRSQRMVHSQAVQQGQVFPPHPPRQ